MLELEGDYGHGFLCYCFSNNGVIEEIFFFFELGLELYLLPWELMRGVRRQIVTPAKTTGGSIMWTRRRGWGG